MASNVNLVAPTVEKQLVELATRMQIMESTNANNPDNLNRITAQYNQDTGVYSGTFSIPCRPTISADGTPSFEAEEYLVD